MSKHFKVSILKSVIRIVGCIVSVATKSLVILASALTAAEIVGVVEEYYEGE